ncbi:MAG TPA: ABC transporter substrate-binding protein [Hyphomonadaceae bacterium]|nr:ABC transporter substrate-binding protein [Hyphomonadaceae bacterium]
MKHVRGLLAAAALLAIAPAAFADKKAEAYVEANANSVLAVLSDRTLNDVQREAKFSEYMNKFAYMPAIARRVLGAQGRDLSDADFNRYFQVFQSYSLETYEVYFDQFRGKSIKVNGSKDSDNRRSTVESTIVSSTTGKPTKVYWDVLQSQDGQTYRVRDVGIDIDGSVLWLAQEQQAQFESYLDRNHGDINKLIERIKQMISDLDSRKKSGQGPAKVVTTGQAKPG